MTKLVSLFLLVFPSFSSFALENNFFVDALETASELYEQGVDHNDIEYKVVLHDQLSQTFPNTQISQIRQSDNALLAALKECLFMKEGAYGDHISAAQQDHFAQQMLLFFSRFNGLSFYKISGNPVLTVFPLHTTTCALAIRQDDLTVIFQGGPSD